MSWSTLLENGTKVAGILSDSSSALSSLGSLFGFGGGMSQKDIMNWQEKMMEKQFGFQSAEAQKQRDWSSNEAKIARDWNSIGSQMDRAQLAGVNPNFLASSGNYGSAGSASAPSGSTASGVFSPVAAPPNQRAESFNLVAQGLQALSAVRSNDTSTEYARRSMLDRLRKVSADADISQRNADILQAVLPYAGKKASAELEQILRKNELLVKQGALTDRQADKFYEEARYWAYKNGVANIFDDDYWRIYKDQQLELSRSQIKVNESQAELNEERRNTEVTTQALNNSIAEANNLANEIRKATKTEEKSANLQKFLSSQAVQELVPSLVQEQLKMAIKNNNWYEADKIVGYITSIIGSSADAINAVGNARGRSMPTTEEIWSTDGEKDKHTIRRITHR